MDSQTLIDALVAGETPEVSLDGFEGLLPESGSPSGRLLMATACSSLLEAAGAAPLPLPEPLSKAGVKPPLEAGPFCPPSATLLIRGYLADSEAKPLFKEALSYLLRLNLKVPVELIADLIFEGRLHDRQTRQKILTITGETGKWLLRMCPEWDAAYKKAQAAEAAVESAEALGRRLVLDGSEASTREIQSSWKRESKDFRKAVLQTLALAPDRLNALLPLVEGAAQKDRSAEIKFLAWGLMTFVPQHPKGSLLKSAANKRLHRVNNACVIKKDEVIEQELTDAGWMGSYDELRSYGIAENFLVTQSLIAVLPPLMLCQAVEASSMQEMVNLDCDKRFLCSLVYSSIIWNDETLKKALLPKASELYDDSTRADAWTASRLFSSLGEMTDINLDELDIAVLTHSKKFPETFLYSLGALPGPWPRAFSERVIEALKSRLGDVVFHDHILASLCPKLDPACLESFRALAESGKDLSSQRTQYILSNRISLFNSFNEPPSKA